MPGNNYDPLYVAAGAAHNVDPRLLATINQIESNGDPSAMSPVGAQGNMQQMPATSQALGVAQPNDPAQAINGSAALIAQNLAATGGNVPDAVRMYFAGPNKAGWGPKTEAYVAHAAKVYNSMPAPSAAVDDSALTSFMAQGAGKATPATAPAAVDDSALTSFMATVPTPAAAPTLPGPPAMSDAARAAHPIAADVLDAANAAAYNPVSQGIERGAHVVLDAPAEALAKLVQNTPIPGAISAAGIAAPTGAQTAATDQADQAQYRAQYANNPLAQAANYGTQAAMVLPALETGAGAMRAGGNALIGGVGDFLAGNGGGNLLARGASLAANGAVAGAAGQAATAGGSSQPIGQQIESGAEGGALAGPVAGAAGAVIGKGLGGFGIDQYTANLAQKAINMGIPLRAGQIAGNPFIRTADDVVSRIPGSGAAGQQEAIQTGINRALANEMGTSAERITPDVMDATKQRLGQTFDAVAQATPVINAQPLLGTFADIEHEASSALPDSEYQPIQKQMQNILNMVDEGGNITGEQYQNLTRKGSPLMNVLNSNSSNVKFYAGQVRNALDGAMQASAPPEAQQALTQARYQYKVMKTIEPLVEKSSTGNINPTLLMGAVRGSFGNMAYNGAGNMGDLARIGQMIKPPPNSGTPERLAVLGALTGGAGSGIIGALHSPVDAAIGLGGAVGVPLAARGANMLLNNSMMRNALINQALGKTAPRAINPLVAGIAGPVGKALPAPGQ